MSWERKIAPRWRLSKPLLATVVGLCLVFVPAFVVYDLKFTINPYKRSLIFMYGPLCLAFLGSTTLATFGRSFTTSAFIPVILAGLILGGYLFAIGQSNPYIGVLYFYVPITIAVSVVGVGLGRLIRALVIRFYH